MFSFSASINLLLGLPLSPALHLQNHPESNISTIPPLPMPSQPWLSNFVSKVLNLSTLFDILISNQPHTDLANDKTINHTYSRFILVHWWIYGTCKMKGSKKTTSKLFLQNYQIPSFLVLSVNNSITAYFWGGGLFCFYRPQWRLMGGARLEHWAWWGVLEEVM